MPMSRADVIRAIRRRMDALGLAVQGRPVLAAGVRRVRGLATWVVHNYLPEAFERRELQQAQAAMADAPAQPEDGPVVLFMSFRAWTSHAAWETVIGQGLRHRGARCTYFYCGGGLPICEIGWPAREAPETPCDKCGGYVHAMLEAARFPTLRLDDLVPPAERDETVAEARATERTGDDTDLDEMVDQSLMWFFRTGTLTDTEETQRARQDFRAGAAVMRLAAPRLLDRIRPDVLVMVNGLFFEERVVRQAALARGIRVVTYEVGAQSGTLFFTDEPDVPAPEYDISDLWSDGGRPLNADEDRELTTVLAARRGGTGLSRRYYRRRRGVEKPGDDRRLVALFTNVSWDTAVTGKSFAFPTMLDWIAETIALAPSHPELEFVVRVHPAESRWPGLETRERAADQIARRFPTLPANVRIVPPEEAVDSYALLDAADIVLVFSSTVGLEAAAAGKPVAVAGKTHYRDRGFTTDVTTPEQYTALFDDLTWTDPDDARVAKARTYAHRFFCRAMIPFPLVVEEEPAEPLLTFTSTADLAPGKDPSLDLVCEGILAGGPFRLVG